MTAPCRTADKDCDRDWDNEGAGGNLTLNPTLNLTRVVRRAPWRTADYDRDYDYDYEGAGEIVVPVAVRLFGRAPGGTADYDWDYD
jgi:hypothetical protein